jgi:hypothetical protein
MKQDLLKFIREELDGKVASYSLAEKIAEKLKSLDDENKMNLIGLLLISMISGNTLYKEYES